MSRFETALFIIKLILSGGAAFFSILVWSKLREAAWALLACGIMLSYAGRVYELLEKMGFVLLSALKIGGFAVIPLLFSVVPPLLCIAACICMLFKN
ncbi:MAG: hypothetical protein NC041_08075 [Bacteroides sp.]|nr:hypothetical protein [Prevotella sp.]MCM1408359.1 hypothetical protein [Treponema brennaborense]MCM1470410.1 hypothetical protein [Bacteroides sp.]